MTTASREPILRAYRVEIDPTIEQIRYLERAAGVARFAYNWALARWRLRYRLHRLVLRAPARTASLLARGGSQWATEAIAAARRHERVMRLVDRLAPNASVETVGELWKRQCPVRPPNAYSLHGELTPLKKTEYPWMREVTAYAVREAVNDVGKAYDHFFRRLREGAVGREAGEPRFRKKSQDSAWHADQGSAIKTRCELVSVRSREKRARTRQEWHGAIYAPGIGWCKLKPGQRIPVAAYDSKAKAWVGDPGVKLCGIGFSRRGGRWFAALRCWVPCRQSKPKEPGSRIGVELGVRELAVTSTERRFGGIRDIEPINRAIRKRKLWERRMARRWKPGVRTQEQSSGWREAQREVAKYHRVIAQLRGESLHYTSRRIVDQGAETVVMREMQVKAMLRRANKRTSEAQRTRNALAPMVSHVGMYELRRQVEYKQRWAGGSFVAAPNDFPATRRCHACGTVRDSDPPYPRWTCAACGSINDRESNAAINLRDYSPSPQGDGGEAGPRTAGQKTRRKTGTTASGSAKPGALGQPDTDGAHGTAEQSARPLGPGNGTRRKAPAKRREKRGASVPTQPGTSGEPEAHRSDPIDVARERSGDRTSGDHGSPPNPESALGARASRSQSGAKPGESNDEP